MQSSTLWKHDLSIIGDISIRKIHPMTLLSNNKSLVGNKLSVKAYTTKIDAEVTELHEIEYLLTYREKLQNMKHSALIIDDTS